MPQDLTMSELNSLQCDDEHLVETFGPLEEIELQTTPEIRAEAQLNGLLAAQRSRHYVDHEQHHKVADKVLCDLLRAKGYERVVKAFEQLHKYYS